MIKRLYHKICMFFFGPSPVGIVGGFALDDEEGGLTLKSRVGGITLDEDDDEGGIRPIVGEITLLKR